MVLTIAPKSAKILMNQLAHLSDQVRERCLPDDLPLDQPIHHKTDQILFDGALRRRKRIVLLTVGCSVGKCAMCPFPNESLAAVSPEDLVKQFDAAFVGDDINNYEIVTLFCNGSFFHDAEIAPSVRKQIYSRIAQSSVRYLAVESLPRFVLARQIEEAKKNIGGKTLAVFMGLQSANDAIREVAINSTSTRQSFEQACVTLQHHDFIPMSFLMVKPPFVTERETIDDVLASLQYLSSLDVRFSTLCPARVAPRTVLELLHREKLYRPLWIWTIVEILKRHHDARGSVPMVNTTELRPDVNLDSHCARACPKCGAALIDGIERFLYSRDIEELKQLSCDCYLEYEDFIAQEERQWSRVRLEDRIRIFLSRVQPDRTTEVVP